MILGIFCDAGHGCYDDDAGRKVGGRDGGLEKWKEGDCYKVYLCDICFENIFPTLEIFIIPEGLAELVS